MLLLAAFAIFVAAQTAPAPPAPDVVVKPDRTVPALKTRIEFTDVKVTGDVVGPAIEVYKAHPKPHQRNMIQLRANFRPELGRSRDRL